MSDERKLFTVVVLVAIALLISSVWLASRASGKVESEEGQYNEHFLTTLNNENESPAYEGKICEHFKSIKTHRNWDWMVDYECFELDPSVTSTIN